MILHIYHGLDNEEVPEDVTHVIVDSSVTVIKENAFDAWEMLVSVIMGDNVKRIESYAFWQCHALRFLRLSNTLEYIGECAFHSCLSLEALFLPSTVKSIGNRAFVYCESLILLILPNNIDLSNVDYDIIANTAIHQIAEDEGLEYEEDDELYITDESLSLFKEWMIHHMDEAPFHKLCYDLSITTKYINDYLTENGDDAALQIDTIHGMTPLHMLTMNPHAPADAIAALFNVNKQDVFCTDHHENTPLENAREYNVGGLIGIISSLCSHRNSLSTPVELSDTNRENTSASKRRKL